MLLWGVNCGAYVRSHDTWPLASYLEVGMTEIQLDGITFAKWGTLALGVGLIAFGLPAAVAPRFFGRQCGIPITDHPADAVAIQSVAMRDIAFGLGLVVAARDGSQLRRWLLVRFLCEMSDCLAILIAFLRGGGNTRLAGLGIFAAASAIFEIVLYVLAGKQPATPSESN